MRYYRHDPNEGMFIGVMDTSYRNKNETKKEISSKYPHIRPLRRIRLEDQIPSILDHIENIKNEKSKTKPTIYRGLINDINVEVIFQPGEVCYITAKTEILLNEAHNNALNNMKRINKNH